MTEKEKLNKVCAGFSLLPDDKQDYILGIIQALLFAVNSKDHNESNREKSYIENTTA